ncbi:polymorphic toxin type 23 domain-containing protein [Tenacibaculum maritimum]|uniref:polymorphic toxin type 23 domain-containing protein n=1 Tax=Tenacibaculum maritimum TaxID=107401 RepID=UPI00040870BD|nr:polymorphic toxin type 23 domain-containing protein [Tenacibaculum maritimum]
MGYIINAAITGQWNWGNFGMSILGGAISGAIGGAIGPTALFKSILTNGFWGTAAIAAASSFLPSLDVKIGDFSFGLSPALAFGRATGFGVNVSVSYQDGDFTFSAGYGVTFYGAAHGTGHKGWEYRKSWGVNWDDGKQGIGIYSTTFSGTKPQKVGGFNFRSGDFRFRYENDGKTVLGKLTSGDTDKYRTNAFELGIGKFSLRGNLYTGMSGTDESGIKFEEAIKAPSLVDFSRGKNGYWKNPDANSYRLGALSFGYKGHRIGVNSEHVRNLFQNIIAHDIASPQPRFDLLTRDWQGYYQYQSYNPYTLW